MIALSGSRFPDCLIEIPAAEAWRVEDEAAGKACHRDDVLHLTEQLRHKRHPPASLAARPLELILEFGVLEILQVVSCRLRPSTSTSDQTSTMRPQAKRNMLIPVQVAVRLVGGRSPKGP
jgi:hypothetical protein